MNLSKFNPFGKKDVFDAAADLKKEGAEVAREVDSIDEGAGFFGQNVKFKEFVPKWIHFDYREGTEKAVRESLMNDVFSVVRDAERGKSDLTYRIIKITNHPHVEPGYMCEVQQGGDGGSYVERVLEEFKDRKVQSVWIELAKSQWAFIELKNCSLETAISPMPAEDGDVVIPLKDKPRRKMTPLFVERYAFFYVSLMLLFASSIALTGAMLFKYVWFDQDKKMVNQNYYTKDVLMPIDALRGSSSSSEMRIAAVKFSPSKGWYFSLQERSDEGSSYYEQKVASDGSVSERVKVRQESDVAIGIEQGDEDVTQ